MTLKPSTKLKSIVTSRASIIAMILAFVLLAVLTAIPFAVKHGAISWLKKNGMAEAHIDNVDFNPFAGTVAVEGLKLLAQSGESSTLDRFSVNLAMTGLVKKRLRMTSLHLEGLHLVVDLGEKITIGGLVLPPGEATTAPKAQAEGENVPEKPWLLGIDDFSVHGTSVALSTPQLALRLGLTDASLTNLHAWNPEEAARLEINGALSQSPLIMSLDLTPFHSAPAVRGGIQLKAFAIDRFHRMAEPHITALRGELTIDTRIAVAQDPDKGTTLSQIGTLSLHNLGGSLEDQGVDLNGFDITWLGDLWAALDSQGTLTDLRSLGRLTNNRVDTVFREMGIRIRHKGLAWDGEMRFQPQLEDGLAARGNLSLKNASAAETKSGKELASLSTLFVYDLKAEGLNKIRTPHISLKGFKALPPRAEIGTIDLSGIALDDLLNLRAETFIIGGGSGTIERDAEGELTFRKEVKALMKRLNHETGPPAPAESEQSAPPQGPAFTYQVGTFRVEGDRLLHFSDQSVTPAFSKTVNLKRFELLGIDSTAPEKDLPLSIEAELGLYETIAVNGTIRPFDPKITAHLDTRITNINLAHLSPYTSQALGYLTETGTFTIDSKVNIVEGALDVTSQLSLHKLELVPDDEGAMDRLLKTLTMPLDYAFSILEDHNRTITLDIPVKGDIHNPDISLDSIIQIAMTKAITTASVSYLSFLLQPYGAVLMVAESAGEFLTHINLEPVRFDVGATEPDQAGLDYLKVVGGLMKKKEVLKLTVCANAVTDDVVMEEETEEGQPGTEAATSLPPLSEETAPIKVDKALYLALARQRAEAIRDILLDDGISPKRIILCHPHFTVAQQKRPEAMMTL